MAVRRKKKLHKKKKTKRLLTKHAGKKWLKESRKVNAAFLKSLGM